MGSCLSAPADGPDDGLLPCFEPIKQIGEGGEGSVWMCRSNQSREDVAIKLISRGAVTWPTSQLECEVLLQCRVGHVNIATVKQVLLTSKYFGIVTEYVEGGNLRSFCKQNHITERIACFFFRQMLNAVRHLHNQGVAHRDIKLSNLLLDNTSESLPIVKLTDFGCAKQWSNKRPGSMHSFTGTPGYMSPELLDVGTGSFNAYDAREADVWALGISLVEMLTGSHLPFCVTQAADLSDDARQVYQQYLEHNVPWWRANKHVQKAYTNFSDELRDLLNNMLEPEPSKRFTLSEVEKHPWAQQELPKDFKQVLAKLDRQQAIRQLKAPSDACADITISKQAQKLLHDMVLVSQLRSPLPHGDALWVFDPRAAPHSVFTRFGGARLRCSPAASGVSQKVLLKSSKLYDRLLADAVEYTSSESSDYVSVGVYRKV